MENDNFNHPPCFPLESVNHEKGSLGGGGGSSSPQQGTHPPQQDEKARLCRRKLTVTSFDPLPRKETAKKQQDSGPVAAEWAAPRAFWSGQREALERGFHLRSPTQVSALKASHPQLGGCYSLQWQCMVQPSVTDKGAIVTITLSKQKHVKFVRYCDQHWGYWCNRKLRFQQPTAGKSPNRCGYKILYLKVIWASVCEEMISFTFM